MRLKAEAAASDDSGIYEEIVYDILNRSNLDMSDKMELLFPSLLYANRFTEASDALLAVDVNEKRYMYFSVMTAYRQFITFFNTYRVIARLIVFLAFTTNCSRLICTINHCRQPFPFQSLI